MIIWIIGKSACGKSTIGRILHSKMKESFSNVIYLDGDGLREAIGEDLGFTVEDRIISEKRTSRLCKLLDKQGIHVVCSKLSNSPEIRRWNKKNFLNYVEIYIKVDDEILHTRDPKNIYKDFNEGKMKNVVGLDIPFHIPTNPTVTISNDGSKTPEEIVQSELKFILKTLD